MEIEEKVKMILEKDYLIHRTDFKKYFKSFYEGKVRDNYGTEKERVIIVSDRLSAFDRVLTKIPYKGQILNQTAAFWFDKTGSNVPNHVISVPDPNIMIVKECKPLPVEMVIRGYITGSAWRAYEKDPDKPISGISFPVGLKKNQQLPEPVITPSTKAEKGIHDEAISREEILNKKIVEKDLYLQMEEITNKLYEMGTNIASKNGLILVDTKYEFGLDNDGKLVVIDEIHTPDSSRYWIKGTYDELFSAGKSPDILDKEFVRDWLREEKNFMGDGPIPEIDTEIKIDLCKRYVKNYEILTGLKFDLETIKEDLPPLVRIESKLKELGYLS